MYMLKNLTQNKILAYATRKEDLEAMIPEHRKEIYVIEKLKDE